MPPILAGREGQGVYVLLFTTLNTVGRMVGGCVPEILLHRYGTPRSARCTCTILPAAPKLCEAPSAAAPRCCSP